MALYVIGDLHLSLSGDKSMDIFPGWHNYVDRIQQNWLAKIRPEDTVVLAGDTSWGMSFAEAKADFEFVNALPGQKIILKGNHDYWWATMNKMNAFFAENGFDTLHILHNNHYLVEGVCICGSRGWLFDQGEPADQKVIAREAGRLEASILSAGDIPEEKVVFLHYPPVYGEQLSPEILEVLLRHKIRRCYYGHIHGAGCSYAFKGNDMGIEFRLISADHLGFDPIRIETPARSGQ